MKLISSNRIKYQNEHYHCWLWTLLCLLCKLVKFDSQQKLDYCESFATLPIWVLRKKNKFGLLFFFLDEPKPKRNLYRNCFKKCNRKSRCRTKCRKKLFSLFNASVSFEDIISIFGEEKHDYENANYCLSFDYRKSSASVTTCVDGVVIDYPKEPKPGRKSWTYVEFNIDSILENFQVNKIVKISKDYYDEPLLRLVCKFRLALEGLFQSFLK